MGRGVQVSCGERRRGGGGGRGWAGLHPVPGGASAARRAQDRQALPQSAPAPPRRHPREQAQRGRRQPEWGSVRGKDPGRHAGSGRALLGCGGGGVSVQAAGLCGVHGAVGAGMYTPRRAAVMSHVPHPLLLPRPAAARVARKATRRAFAFPYALLYLLLASQDLGGDRVAELGSKLCPCKARQRIVPTSHHKFSRTQFKTQGVQKDINKTTIEESM
eukprot:1530626-Rhodomonas_salina.2